jgi:hypothetical protein
MKKEEKFTKDMSDLLLQMRSEDLSKLTRDTEVIGFQVVGEDGTPQEGEIHPDMAASFCLYNLSQAQAMVDKNNNGQEQWKLLAIWSDDVENPTMMFSGDPRT